MSELRPLRLLVLLAPVFLAPPTVHRMLAQTPDLKKRVPTTGEATDAVKKVLRLKAASYHVFLRDASLLVPPSLIGLEWEEVQRLMQKHSFTVVEAWENGDAIHSHHLL